MVVSDQLQAPAALHLKKTFWYLSDNTLSGFQNWSG